MGDRTTVTLTVLNAQAAKAEALFEYGADQEQSDDAFTSFIFNEVNYGTLDFLPALLAVGIAYDSEWERGGDFVAGSEYGRFTPEGYSKVLGIDDCNLNPDIYSLMGLIDDPVELRAYIMHHHQKATPLPWDNQEEYGKLYLARQLINPD